MNLRPAGSFAVKVLATAADLLRPASPGPRILIYHQVGAGLGRNMEVPVDRFAVQMHWLSSNFEVVALETALRERHRPEASRMVALTFDDGYADVYRNAWPILRDLGLPFTLYLTSRPIEVGEPIGERPEASPLTWEQVVTMADEGRVTVGAHTHTHPDMRTLDVVGVRRELETSNLLIQTRTGIVPRHFAYPWGYWAAAADAAVRQSYESAVLGSGPPVTGTTDAHLVHRVPIQLGDGMFFFRRKLRSGLRFEDRVRRIRRGYRGP